MFLTHGHELNAHALAGSDISHHRGAADLAFGHRKQQRDGSADGRWRLGVDEEAADIQIPDTRDALRPIMLPGDPDALWRRNSWVTTIALRWINQRS